MAKAETGRVAVVPVVAVVPAAGQSARFGSMKLLADVSGQWLVDRTVGCLLDAGVSQVVVVVRAPDALAPAQLLADSRVRTVVNADPSRGMFSSIQLGLAAADGCSVLVLPADMPFVRPSTVSSVIDASRTNAGVIVPIYLGRRGHPVVIPGPLARALCADPPTTTLKAALIAHGTPIVELAVEDAGILRDVDTPADLI